MSKDVQSNVGNSVFRTTPFNIDVEQELIGVFLFNNNEVVNVSDRLLPEHFFVPMHKRIYEVILKLIEREMVATPMIVKSYIGGDVVFKDTNTDCAEYLSQLTIKAQLTINIQALANIIIDLYMRRQLIDVGHKCVSLAETVNDPDNTAMMCLENVEQQLFNLATYGDYDSKYYYMKDAVAETIHRINVSKKNGCGVSGVATGYYDLDKLTGGLQNSDLIIIAARPSMGKTAFAINIAYNVAINFFKESSSPKNEKNNNSKNADKPMSVAIFSIEMSAEQIATRIVSMKTGIDSGKIRTGMVSKEDFAKISSESVKISSLPMIIDDGASPTISAIRTKARRMKRRHNIGLLVIDYLQLIRASNSVNYSNRVQEVAEISQGLKAIAKELHIPVIALSQLSRGVELRDSKRPQLSDLRESGNIEQEADIVMFIYREEYYLSRSIPNDPIKNMEWQESIDYVKNIAEIIISKQRNGPIGSFLLRFDGATTSFSNYSDNNN